jgi:hypothetical protein
VKHLNWGLLTDDILEVLVMNQTQLATVCQVTQQSVSNWKTGVRSPGVFARNELRRLAKDAKLSIDDYKKSRFSRKTKDKSKGNDENEPSMPDDIFAFALRLSNISKNQRNKIIDMAEFIITRDS